MGNSFFFISFWPIIQLQLIIQNQIVFIDSMKHSIWTLRDSRWRYAPLNVVCRPEPNMSSLVYTFFVSEEDNMIPVPQGFREVERSRHVFLTQLILLQRWNMKSSTFAHHVSAFLTLRCAEARGHELILENTKMWNHRWSYKCQPWEAGNYQLWVSAGKQKQIMHP